ncbi:hypothetical protein B0J14DRAFT_661754 [Halenospora varia]|nr:hypothetical protein B0J14DRAFT_661754 [Halenospora varia]
MSSRTAFPRDDAESLDRSRETAHLGVALAEISLPVLAAALARSELTISDLQDAGHIKRLYLPEGALLTHYYRQHRLEAAKQHIYPHNEWWAVELYNKERWDNKCRVQEQDRNIESIPYDDGTVFRFLDAEPDWRMAWRSKDAENDLKAIEKRPALYKGFTSLRPFICILDSDEELMYNLDPETVELFEGRAPKTSSADRDFITRAIKSRSAFPLLYDDVKRLRLLQNVVAVDRMIPLIKTLAKDSLYLEDCAKAMRTLIDPTECHIREAMQHMWRGYRGDYIVLESADGLTEYRDTRTGDEEGFQIAILNADADREHARNMLTIARPPGRYDYDLKSEITGHYQLLTRIRARQQELLRPPVWTTTLSNVKVKQRYGRPHNQALKDCAPYFFLHNICEIPESEDINAGAMSQGFQERVAELELVSQRQAEDLRNSKGVATIKGRTLDMILAKIKETREGVEKMSTAFTGRLQLEPNYKDGDCKTIHLDELQFEDLPVAEAQFDEIEDLKKSIAKFIALYSQNNLAQDENARVKILEWQKLVPGERLAIADGTGAGVKTGTPDLKQMLVVVSRRAGVLEQEGRAAHDLQAELDMARAAAESQRQKAERVEWLEGELVEVKKQLQQEQVAARDLGESLKTACDATQRDIELTSVLKGELDTAKAENKALLQQGKAAIAELTAELKTVKAEAETFRKEAERDLKSAKAEVDKRLETSKSQVTGLEKDVEAARQSIKERERELASLKLEIDDEDERIRLLKAQLFETNRMIQLEKEKEKLEAEQKEIQAALAEAKASSSQDLGELM